MEIRDLLSVVVERDASDLYLTAGSPPMVRIEGVVQPAGAQALTPGVLRELAEAIMSHSQKQQFARELEINMALSYPGLGRFRVNIFRQKGLIGLVIRKIKLEIPTVDQLGLPPVIKDIAMRKRGLVLVVGATGCGKSTTLAAMIDHRNSNLPGHIVSVEDPIEFIHEHKKSIVTQREIGFDTHSYANALKNTLRQAPDVILISEIRDSEAMEAAVTFAETGHLCLATLHSNNANQAIERIMNFFPPERHTQIYLQLSLNLCSIISQRLIPALDGRRVAALEILLDTPRIKDLIKKGEVDTLKEAMEQGVGEGCQTFDQAILTLYREGRISIDQALINADSVNNLRLKIKMEGLKGEDAIDRLLENEEKKAEAFRIKGLKPTGRPIRKF